MRPLSIRISLFLAVVAAISACGPRDAHYGPKALHLSGQVWPPEIAHKKKVVGVFPVDAASDPATICCWIAPSATFSLGKHRSASRLRLSLYIPDVPAFHDKGQTVTVSFSNGKQKTVRGIKPGFRTIELKVPQKMREASGPQLISLRSDVTFMPQGEHGPHYAAILTSAYFQ